MNDTRDPFTRPEWSYPNTQGTAVLVHHSESDHDPRDRRDHGHLPDRLYGPTDRP